MSTLIRGATVITLSSEPADPTVQDVLVEGETITAIGAHLDAAGADVIDGHGRIVMPGLVNAHMHTWQSAFRGIAYDSDLMEYLQNMHFRVAPRYTPEDMHIGTLAGALNQIACGTTTLADWCHNNRTPAHTDAAVAALQQSGLRAVFLPGAIRPVDPENQKHPTEIGHDRSELDRLAAGAFPNRGGLLTLGMSVYGPQYAPLDVATSEFRLAKERGMIISMHSSGGPSRTPDAWEKLAQDGLLGPHVNIVHGNEIPDDLLGMLIEHEVSFTITPEVEMNCGHGQPVTGRLLKRGAMPSLGVDIESAISGDMFTVARTALAHQRMLDHSVRKRDPETGPPPLFARDALTWAIRGGARALGLEDKIGSLEVGKQADLVMIDTRCLNLWPVHDAYATALQAHAANIEAVMIAGTWRKRNGKLLQASEDVLLDKLSASARRISVAAGLPTTQAH